MGKCFFAHTSECHRVKSSKLKTNCVLLENMQLAPIVGSLWWYDIGCDWWTGVGELEGQYFGGGGGGVICTSRPMFGLGDRH